ncbi:MAG: 1-acyl-sn-glycerol-3-phosphate acyltransferase [Oscillospiraceae bacterium]|nr:1-acyl-sn-glycerol-3-phosphate acyltransferase [Oscillospiraceae bacterium]
MKSTHRAYKILWHVLWPFVMLFNRPVVNGVENIPEGAAVICANHRSMMDPLILAIGVGCKYWLHFMAKIELMKIPVVGAVLKKIGCIGVDRGRSDIKAIKDSLMWLKKGQLLAIFPEGTRVNEGEDSEAKTGAAMLSIKTGAPIVPVHIENPRGHAFKKMRVHIGKAFSLDVSGVAKSEAYKMGAEIILNRINDLGRQDNV